MKPFDLEKAKAGAKVISRRGFPARILCYDLQHDDYSLVVAIACRVNGTESIVMRRENGMGYTTPDDFDLFMAPEKCYGAMWLDKDGEPTCTLGLYDSVHELQSALWAKASQPNFKIVEFEV